MKECTTCGETKPHSEFYRDAKRPDGLYSRCKSCHRAATDRWKAENRSKVNEIARASRQRNHDTVRERQRAANAAAYRADPAKYRARQAEFRRQHPERAAEIQRKAAAKRKDKLADYLVGYYEANKDTIKARSAARYREKRAELRPAVAERVMRRNARKRQAVPAWADPMAMRRFYEEAKRLTDQTGREHQVDHIVPLQSKWVCGLHVEHNLRVLERRHNQSKGNRVWPDCPDHLLERVPEHVRQLATAARVSST